MSDTNGRDGGPDGGPEGDSDGGGGGTDGLRGPDGGDQAGGVGDAEVSPVDAVMRSSRRFNRLLIDSVVETVARDLPAIEVTYETGPDGWRYLLLCASAATGSGSTIIQDAVLRALQGCLQSESSTATEKEAAALLLERSGNRPAIDLAVSRDLVSATAWSEAPPPLRLDVIRRRLQLRIDLANGTDIATNAFQRDFWSAAEGNTWVSVSAPTSAGKSFIVKQWFLDAAARQQQFVGVYVVPTRALIEEVASDFAEDFPADVAIHTMPWDLSAGDATKEVYVLTQERLHLLQQQKPMFVPDVLFVDEAHKIGDGARGVLLQLVLDEAVRRDPGTRVLFASPLTSNPELLLQAAPENAKQLSLTSSMVTVNQNLLWVDRVPRRPTRMAVDLLYDGEPVEVGSFEIAHRTGSDRQRFALVVAALASDAPGNVVYCNGAAEAETIAEHLYEALGSAADVSTNAEIVALRELVETTIHDKFVLSTVLERGIAFHYGNMPLLVKSEVERLFKANIIKYLVCTSTLLEGVNLPCRNLFVRGPRKGNNNPMSASDFWNLAGRAGRWGKEFQGNIVCVDPKRPNVWADPPRRRVPQPIARAADPSLRAPESLIELILAGTDYDSTSATTLPESIFNFLAGRLARGISLASIPGLPADAPDQLAEVEAVIEQALAGVRVPVEVLTRHTGINPLRMDALHRHFESLDDASLLDARLPGPGDVNAVTYYTDALGVAGEYLGGDFGGAGRRFQLGLLLVHWMRGYSLARIIRERQDVYLRRGQVVRLPTLIRDVMGDVENYARFEAPRFLACYLDILNRELVVRGLAAATDEHDIEMMLELGVSRTTEVSFMALGLSRATVLLISDLIDDSNMSPEDCRVWLDETDVETLGFPVLILAELVRVRDRRRLG